ncbi:flagellar export protein FliJ [Granulosicoccaceae sp. 1_MG-2023]|nr:flagellar export protein FliJ [Granulosicoccaceae sp. 1_MG-2023]
MNKETHRLAPVVDMARQREEKAARELARVRELVGRIGMQVEQMHRYREDYRSGSLLGKTHSMATMRDTQLFLARLNQTIAALEGQHKQAEKRYQASLQAWRNSRAWLKSLENVVDRQVADYRKTRQSLEQKQLDELAGLYAGRDRHSF